MAMTNAARAAASKMGPTLPAPIAVPSGVQSTVAAPFSHAMSPVMKAATASVHRFSDRDICCRSKRRWRAVTGTAPSRVSRTIQTASITRPIPSATHGYAVLSMGERSAEPAHAAIGSAQIRLESAAKPVRPNRSTSLVITARTSQRDIDRMSAFRRGDRDTKGLQPRPGGFPSAAATG